MGDGGSGGGTVITECLLPIYTRMAMHGRVHKGQPPPVSTTHSRIFNAWNAGKGQAVPHACARHGSLCGLEGAGERTRKDLASTNLRPAAIASV